MKMTRCTFLLLVLSMPLASFAAQDDAESRWTTRIAGQGDNKDGWLVDGSMGYSPDQVNRFALNVAHGASSSGASTITTNNLGVRYAYDGKRGGFSIGGRWYDDVSVLTGKEASAATQIRGESWHAQIRGTYRQTEFEPFRADTNLWRRDGTLISVAAVATCDIESHGYGGEVGFDGSAVQAYVGSMQYRHRDTHCTFDRPGLSLLASTTRAEFAQLAGLILQQLSRLAVSQLHTENSFLSSDVTAGMSFMLSSVQFGLDYQQAREQFSELRFNTYTASANLLITAHSDLTIHAGATEAHAIGSVIFAGVTLTTHW